MKNTLAAIILGTFVLMSHLTAGELSSDISNDLNNNPQIEIQLDRIEYISNQPLTGTFRLKLHAGSQEIYNEIIDFSTNSRTIVEEIPNGRIGNLNISDTELIITVEAIDSGLSDSRNVGRLDTGQTFDATLHLRQGNNRNSGIIVQGSVRLE